MTDTLVEGIDFYIEDGKYVFTERYLRNRGYCCSNGCRHCPYGFAKRSGVPEAEAVIRAERGEPSSSAGRKKVPSRD